MLIYKNSASPMSLVCNPSHNITNPTDPSNNFLSLNNHRIPFLWTSSKKLLLFSSFDIILVIVDWLTKQTIFISVYNIIISTDLAHLFILYVFSKHGVPSHVTSNKGLEFVSNFFYSLGTALNRWLHFTSGYHPEDDGQTKCTNQTLEQYLYVYCNY